MSTVSNDAARFQTSWQRAGVSIPGMPVLPPNVERHPIPGGGSRAVEVTAGDVISVLDIEGLQAVELTLFGPDGRSDAGMLGTVGINSGASNVDTSSLSLADTLRHGGISGQRVLNALRVSGFDLQQADVIRLFDGDSRAGEIRSLSANASGLLIVAAVATPMSPHEQNTATDITLYIERQSKRDQTASYSAPPPLADALLDQNVLPGQAFTYQVAAGQFIQVLDVHCLLYTSPSPRDRTRSRMPSSA